MKKLLFITALVFLGLSSVDAQVKAGFGLGYAFPSGDIADFTDAGVSGYVELGYGFAENMDISLLWQGDFLVGADLDGGVSLGNITISSFMANGRYFFNENKFRPYAGLGLGFAKISQAEIILGDVNIDGFSESNFALRPSLGFKYGILNVNAAYLSAGKIEDISVGDISLNIGLLFTFGK